MKFTKNPFQRRTVLASIMVATGLLPTAVLANEVALKSSDGAINIVGEFVDFQENHYIIRTALGDLRVAASRVSCEGGDCPVIDTASADVMFVGSNTVGRDLLPLLISGFASHLEAEASVVITARENEKMTTLVGEDGYGDALGSYLVTSTTTDDAFRALGLGTAHIGLAARRIQPNEARELRSSGAGNMISSNQEHIIAIESIVVITHPENPVNTLTMTQLRDIYAGEIKNWSTLGGEDRAITVVGREAESDTTSVFTNNVFGNTGRGMTENVVIATGNTAVATTVYADPAAIGFVGQAFQRGGQPVTLVNDCGIPMTPDAFSAKTNEYALQRQLYFYNRADIPADQASEFLSFVTSDDADNVISKAGFIGLGITSRDQSVDSVRARVLQDASEDTFEGTVMADMLGQLPNYDRLSTTFRFRSGSSRMNERAIFDMERLTEYLIQKPDGTKVMFVGFTDNVGPFESNQDLSIKRAGQILDTVVAASQDQLAHIEMGFTGYGEIAASACNIDETGRGINRRVEVWISKASN